MQAELDACLRDSVTYSFIGFLFSKSVTSYPSLTMMESSITPRVQNDALNRIRLPCNSATVISPPRMHPRIRMCTYIACTHNTHTSHCARTQPSSACRPCASVARTNRYGNCFYPIEITADTFRKILAVADNDQTALLTKWYCLDTNMLDVDGESSPDGAYRMLPVSAPPSIAKLDAACDERHGNYL